MRRILYLILFLAGLFSSMASADQQETQANIALIRNASAALQNTRPDLAQALSIYADHLASPAQTTNPEDYAKVIDSETEKVKTAVNLFGNAILAKNRDELEQLTFFNPNEVFDHKRGQLRNLIADYHNKSNNHDLVNFNIISVKLNDELTQAGVRVEGFFLDKEGATIMRPEGWVFIKDNSSQEWLFDEVAYSSGNKERKN